MDIVHVDIGNGQEIEKYLKYTIYHLNKDEILLRLINLAEYKSL